MSCDKFNLSSSTCTEVTRGDSYRFNIVLESDGEGEDLTGKDLRFTIRNPSLGGVADIVLEEVVSTTLTGIYYRDRLLGDFDIQMDVATTLGLTEKSYLYELRDFTAQDTIMYGAVQITEGAF